MEIHGISKEKLAEIAPRYRRGHAFHLEPLLMLMTLRELQEMRVEIDRHLDQFYGPPAGFQGLRRG